MIKFNAQRVLYNYLESSIYFLYTVNVFFSGKYLCRLGSKLTCQLTEPLTRSQRRSLALRATPTQADISSSSLLTFKLIKKVNIATRQHVTQFRIKCFYSTIRYYCGIFEFS